MATFAEKYAAGSYSVNTAHAKCPDHLYLIDEGSGSTLNDRGKTGGLNATITGATWGTDDLTAGGGTSPVLTFDGTGDYARTSTGFTFGSYKSVLLVCLAKTTNATAPTGNQTILSLANSANSTDFAVIRGRITDGYLAGVYDDSAIASASRAVAPSIYDQAWHMLAVRIVQTSTTNIQAATSLDGSTWSTAGYTIATDAALWNMNRLCLGDTAGSSLGVEFSGKIASASIYRSVADGTTTWNQTFIDELYADPWQFLTVDSGSSLILPHRSGGGFLDLQGNFRG